MATPSFLFMTHAYACTCYFLQSFSRSMNTCSAVDIDACMMYLHTQESENSSLHDACNQSPCHAHPLSARAYVHVPTSIDLRHVTATCHMNGRAGYVRTSLARSTKGRRRPRVSSWVVRARKQTTDRHAAPAFFSPQIRSPLAHVRSNDPEHQPLEDRQCTHALYTQRRRAEYLIPIEINRDLFTRIARSSSDSGCSFCFRKGSDI